MLTTVPGVRMRRRDMSRLAALIRRFEHTAGRRVSGGVDLAPRLARLRRAADVASRRPTRRALGIFVDADWEHTVTLPQPVYDRVVVDSHFDSRDLLYAEQFHPAFRVLAGDSSQPVLYESHEDALIERPLPHAASPEVAGAHAVARRVAARLAALDTADPRPLVLACREPALAAHAAAVVVACAGSIEDPAADRAHLHRAARLRVTEWCAERARAAIPSITGPGWTSGSAGVQRAVATNPRGFLLVEANHNDRLARGVHVVDPAAFGYRPAGLNAAIARVRSGGGTVWFVPDGDLRDLDGVAYRRNP